MRLLYERSNHECEGEAGCEAAPDGYGNSASDEQHSVPLWNLLPSSGCHQTGNQVDRISETRFCQQGGRMRGKTSFPKEFAPILESLDSAVRNNGTSRRSFLKRSGLLVIGFSMASLTE